MGEFLFECFNNWQMMMVIIFRVGARHGGGWKPPFHGLRGGGRTRGEAGSLLSMGCAVGGRTRGGGWKASFPWAARLRGYCFE